jgi:hypothetical protein
LLLFSRRDAPNRATFDASRPDLGGNLAILRIEHRRN